MGYNKFTESSSNKERVTESCLKISAKNRILDNKIVKVTIEMNIIFGYNFLMFIRISSSHLKLVCLYLGKVLNLVFREVYKFQKRNILHRKKLLNGL